VVVGGNQRGRQLWRERRPRIGSVVGAAQRPGQGRRIADPREDQHQPCEPDRTEHGQGHDRTGKPLDPPQTVLA
jgi:hypothetical protein